jgi:hypothetical protein
MMPYVPCWCEENIWFRCRALSGGARQRACVVFISNASRTVACWSQRAASRPDEAVVWDYHVVLLTLGLEASVEDPDCTAGEVLPLPAWIAATFPLASDALPAELRPRFRLASAEVFLADFASDRSHMRGAGGAWLAPPPPWAPPQAIAGSHPGGSRHTLPRWWDTEDPGGPGITCDLEGLRAFAALHSAG